MIKSKYELEPWKFGMRSHNGDTIQVKTSKGNKIVCLCLEAVNEQGGVNPNAVLISLAPAILKTLRDVMSVDNIDISKCTPEECSTIESAKLVLDSCERMGLI